MDCVCRVGTGHGKPGKSWNLRISFSRPGKSWNFMVRHGKSWKFIIIIINHCSCQSKDKMKQRRVSIKQSEVWRTEVVNLFKFELSYVRKYPKARRVFKIFLRDS